jgi:DNA primase
LKGHIPQEIIEEIKNRANIVEVVSEYIALKKTGRNFVGLCPFHKEKTPSFTVNPEKQIFYCFGCGQGGNAITFVMRLNDMTFPEAVRQLAGKMGIAIPVKKMTVTEKREFSEKEKIIRINLLASEYFSKNFTSNRGKEVRDYITKRGLNGDVLREFGIGYSLDGWRHLKDYFEEKKVPLRLVERAGLIISKDKENFYDRFRGRLIFPIVDLNGGVVAFGGRTLADEDPKYLNSPESPVYTKGKTLYGLYNTKNDIRKKDYAIIVEGYFDLLSLWSKGVTNVIATLGTALTRNQIELIRRFTRNIVIIFDPDEGGRSAVERSLQLFLEEKMNAKVAVLPDNCDPADFVMKYGRDAVEDIIMNSSSMVDYYIDSIVEDRETLEEKMDSIRDSVSFIAGINDPIQRNLFIKRVSEKFGIEQRLLKTEIGKAFERSKKLPKSQQASKKEIKKVDHIELGLIHMIFEYPEKTAIVIRENIIDYFTSTDLKKLGKSLMESFEDGKEKSFSDIADDLEDGDVKDSLLKLMVGEPTFDDDVIDRVFDDTIRKIKLKWYKNRHGILKRELARAQEIGDRELSAKLLVEKENLLKEEREAY